MSAAGAGGWLFAFASDDSDTFFAAVALVKGLPEHRWRWRPADRAWWIANEALPALLIMIPGLEAYMAEASHTRAGGSRSSSRSSSRRACGPTVDAPAVVRDAFAELHLLPSAWPELVRSAHRIAARRLHPDLGGEHARMVAANLAAEQALAWAQRHDAGGAV
jgi:hypothetical protein